MELDTEINFYKMNRKEFVQQYENKYLVIKGTSVIGVYDTHSIAFDTAIRMHERGSFIIERPMSTLKN